MVATILVTWVDGVESGLIAGVGLSIFLHLYATSRPHVAVIGQIPGTSHFRNVERHEAVTDPEILSMRVDASLYFPNARFIEELVNESVAANPAIRHVILECIAVNTIDLSALESLSAVNKRLADGGITLAPVRGEGAGDGSTEAIALPAGTDREGASVAFRCGRQHQARTREDALQSARAPADGASAEPLPDHR